MNSRLAGLTLLILASHALAADGEERSGEREHERPPRVAVEACAAAVRGDACSFEGRDGERVDGSCEAPADKPLACRPANAPRHELVERQ